MAAVSPPDGNANVSIAPPVLVPRMSTATLVLLESAERSFHAGVWPQQLTQSLLPILRMPTGAGDVGAVQATFPVSRSNAWIALERLAAT